MAAAVDCEALVAAMTLVPAFLSRNRSFHLFEDPDIRRARRRAARLRGIVRQLGGAYGKVESLRVVANKGGRELRYQVPRMRVDRCAVLTELEYSLVAYLAARSGVSGLSPGEEDRARIDAALRQLGCE
jgi:hypothetical protein